MIAMIPCIVGYGYGAYLHVCDRAALLSSGGKVSGKVSVPTSEWEGWRWERHLCFSLFFLLSLKRRGSRGGWRGGDRGGEGGRGGFHTTSEFQHLRSEEGKKRVMQLNVET